MKTTISLGKELAYHANRITNVYTTKDYIGELISQYEEHVEDYYGEEVTNDFDCIYRLYKVLDSRHHKADPCDSPLNGIDDIADDLLHIVSNRKAYNSVFNILLDKAKSGGSAGKLVYDVIYALKSDSKGFKSAATKYDRYMGNILPASSVIAAIAAYGRLSGLVDYYNFQEGKDGCKEE